MHEFAEGYELHDVGRHVALVLLGPERHFVRIKLVHRAEIGRAYTHDNDTKGLAAASHNLVNRPLHVIDYTICNDQQDVVLLILLRDVHLLCHFIYQVQDRSEMGRTIQVDMIDRMLVCLDNAI